MYHYIILFYYLWHDENIYIGTWFTQNDYTTYILYYIIIVLPNDYDLMISGIHFNCKKVYDVYYSCDAIYYYWFNTFIILIFTAQFKS